MPNTSALCAAIVAALVLVGSAAQRSAAAAPQGGGITDASRLAAIYDTILAARFDQARAELSRACPPAPQAACDDLREVALWWQIQENPRSRLIDARFEQLANTAIDSATQWTEREPGRGEAWFYLAGAYAPLSQWRVVRGERLAAARDGKRIKDALERALSLDSSLQDAWFGIGLYHYYADVAPAALKFLRFLLLLPGGDRAQGLQEMERARTQGALLRGEADYQMHWLYLWYEHQPSRALELLRGLDAKYPTNPLFLEQVAEVEHEYLHDHRASLATWASLLARSQSGAVMMPRLAESRARVGIADESIELSNAARAIEMLLPVVRARSAEPYGILARAELSLGDAYALAGNLGEALDAYTRAQDDAPRDDPDGVRDRARAGLSRVRSAR